VDVLVRGPENAVFDFFNHCLCAGSGRVEVAVGISFPAFDAALFECLT
jgi:hypothetical protein